MAGQLCRFSGALGDRVSFCLAEGTHVYLDATLSIWAVAIILVKQDAMLRVL